jgi:hypothetical protein
MTIIAIYSQARSRELRQTLVAPNFGMGARMLYEDTLHWLNALRLNERIKLKHAQ